MMSLPGTLCPNPRCTGMCPWTLNTKPCHATDDKDCTKTACWLASPCWIESARALWSSEVD